MIGDDPAGGNPAQNADDRTARRTGNPEADMRMVAKDRAGAPCPAARDRHMNVVTLISVFGGVPRQSARPMRPRTEFRFQTIANKHAKRLSVQRRYSGQLAGNKSEA